MVLWELTLATAYFLGLKRTYRLALRIQRKVLPKSGRLRCFAQRRTRFAFDTVIKIQKKFAAWDMSPGKRLGNWILRRSPAAPQIGKDPPLKIEKMPTLPPVRAIAPPSFNPLGSLKSSWRPLNKDIEKSQRLYSVLPGEVSYERSRLKSSIIREDIAMYANLPLKYSSNTRSSWTV